ncbi:hypothetical protein BGZ79_005823 [Entomortierella chlamydospora]|nr:hypothetical protein BGZ79_005823 [Entomortierella chlamydospora]
MPSSPTRSSTAAVHESEFAAHDVGDVADAVAIDTAIVAAIARLAAAGTPHRADGIWKRTLQALTIRKAHVDKVCPIAKTSFVYYDDDVYDAVLTEKNNGVTCVTQLIYDTETMAYYIYYRSGETDYKLNGPHQTTEAAKDAFQLTYKEKFDVEWTERKTAVSDKWTYEAKTYVALGEVVEVVEPVDENSVVIEGDSKEVATLEESEIASQLPVSLDSPWLRRVSSPIEYAMDEELKAGRHGRYVDPFEYVKEWCIDETEAEVIVFEQERSRGD